MVEKLEIHIPSREVDSVEIFLSCGIDSVSKELLRNSKKISEMPASSPTPFLIGNIQRLHIHVNFSIQKKPNFT